MLKHTLDSFFNKYHPLKYKKNNIIINAYETPSGVYFVENGYVRMYTDTADGKELTLNIFKPGAYFPMIWAIADIENTYYFQSITSVVLRRAPKKDVLEFIKNNQDVLFNLTKRILIGVNGLVNNPELLLFGDAHKRVLSVFSMCAKRFGTKTNTGKIIINLPLTHQDIARLCGLTRETVTLEIQKIIKSNLVTYNKKIYTINNLSVIDQLILN